MNEKSLNIVVLAEFDSLVSGLLKVDGIRYAAVSSDHLIERVVVETESVSVDGCYHVDAAVLEAS